MAITRSQKTGGAKKPGRMKVLMARLENAGIDWKTPLANVPHNERARVAALATLLGIDANLALNPKVSLDELINEAARMDLVRGGREA
jgi:hypothetical protein